ncbi:MAG: ATP-binding protein [Methylovulum sp.]|nr:ATP-binding protein [Methylovulum sp.]
MVNSLYVRLNLTAILVLVIFLTATGAVLDTAFVETARASLRERMMGQLYQLLSAAEVEETGELVMPLPTHLPYPQLALPDSGLYAFIGNNQSDNPLWRSPSLQDRPTPAPFVLQVGEKHWADVHMPDGKDYCLLGFGFQRTLKNGIYAFNFYLMDELQPLHQQITLYRQRLWGGLASAAILLLASQIWLLHWGLNPLRKVRRELNAIEIGERNQINGDYPREIKQLTDHINSLLSQERARQTRYRNALADLAHSLKTPLAVLIGAVDQPETLPESVTEQSARMMRIVERQLQRAGAASHAATAPAIAVHGVADRLTASLGKVYRNKNLQISNRVDPHLRLRCDEADLIEILGNLLDNACKWGDRRVEIQGHKENQRLTLSIHDDGPGINTEQISHILKRGGRADESTPGHGLGLSVVAEIIEVYQGTLRIEASFLGGAAVSVEFLL